VKIEKRDFFDFFARLHTCSVALFFSLSESQKRGFVPPPGYLHPHQLQQQGHQQAPGAPRLPGYSPYYRPYPGFFPVNGSETRAGSVTTSPPVDAQGYGSSSSPPTPPVTPSNRHQLPPYQHQQLGAGNMTASVSPSGTQHSTYTNATCWHFNALIN